LTRQRAAPAGSGLLALGDPDFGARPAAVTAKCGQFAGMWWPRLPGSAAEIDRLGALWNARALGPVEALRGDRATEAAFEAAARGRRVIHLATHAVYLDASCGGAVADENPLLRSGLALAGRGAHVLTAEEIASLPLDGTEWAVLSGCDTGLGQVTSGENVLGLPRAFELAGARTVIMSLWPVEDQSAAEWMGELYRLRWVRHLSTAEAVRGAELHVLRLRRAKGLSAHPFYWGQFVALGAGEHDRQ